MAEFCRRCKYVVTGETVLPLTGPTGYPDPRDMRVYQFRKCSVCGNKDSRWMPPSYIRRVDAKGRPLDG